MSARSASLLVLSFALIACAPGEPGSAARGEGPAPAPAAAPSGPQAPPAPAAPPVDDGEPARAIIYNVNLAFVVDDPGGTLEQAETMLRKLGGEVTYASANGDNANLNGKVPIEARHRLRDALAKLDGSMQSENLSTSDVGHEVRRLRRRLAALQHANARIASMFTGQQDPTQVEAAALLRELTDRERQSVEAQLESYRTQTRDAQVNVSFTRPPR